MDAHFADRRHQREIEALDMASDLSVANQRLRLLEEQVKLLTEENNLLKLEVVHNRERLDGIKEHWKEDRPPPDPPRSSDSIPVFRPDPARTPTKGGRT
jgi:regulator of replication initiation timing